MWDLAGGVAVITGAGSGIGRELAKRLAREKMSLALADVNQTTLQETLNQIGAASASAGDASGAWSITWPVAGLTDG